MVYKKSISTKASVCHTCGKSLKRGRVQATNNTNQVRRTGRGQFFGPLRWFPFEKK